MAARSGMKEVELSEIAQRKAKNSEVRLFAAMMLKDHSKANSELMSIAHQRNITLPASADNSIHGQTSGTGNTTNSSSGSTNTTSSGSTAGTNNQAADNSANSTSGNTNSDVTNSGNAIMSMDNDVSLAADKTMLMNASGAAFDRMYMKMMVEDHEKAVALFTSASKSEDSEVKLFAVKKLPTLEMHLSHAKSLSRKLNNQ